MAGYGGPRERATPFDTIGKSPGANLTPDPSPRSGEGSNVFQDFAKLALT